MEENRNYRFRGECTMTPQRLYEFNAGYQECNPLNKCMKIIMIFISLLDVYFTIAFPWAITDKAWLMALVCIGWLALDLLPRLTARKGNIQYKRSLVANGGKPVHGALLFYEDGFTDRNLDTGNEVAYRYDQIRKIIETNHLLVLVLDYRLGVLLDKDTIAGGSLEDLKAFLLEKSQKIRKKKISYSKSGTWIHHIAVASVIAMLIASLLSLLW